MTDINMQEHEFTMCGVKGRMMARHVAANGLLSSQVFKASRPCKYDGKQADITVEVRFDDECRNGHQSFAITGHIQRRGARDWDCGGCIHEEIEKYFPELAHLIKWHLVDTDSPMHYVANAVYHASNRDHNGKLKGEPWAWSKGIRFGNSPITVKLTDKFYDWLVYAEEFNSKALKTNPAYVRYVPVAVPHKNKDGDTYKFADKYTFKGYDVEWHYCPFDTAKEAEEFSSAMLLSHTFVKIPTLFSEGKERDLDAARRAAKWPEATDEQLMSENLKELLEARLPGLVAAFKKEMTEIGFEWREITK